MEATSCERDRTQDKAGVKLTLDTSFKVFKLIHMIVPQVCWCAATSVKGYGILKTSLTVSSCLWGVQIMARLNKGWKKWSKSVLLYWMWACTTFVTAWSLNVAWSVSNYTGTDWRFVTHLNVRNLCVHTYRFAGTYRCKTCRQLLFLLHYCRN